MQIALILQIACNSVNTAQFAHPYKPTANGAHLDGAHVALTPAPWAHPAHP